MVQLLSALSLEHLPGVRPHHPRSPTPAAPETTSPKFRATATHPALAQCLLYEMRVRQPERNPHSFRQITRNLLTGEPYAGKPHVRFGGRGAATQCGLPTPIV